MSLPSIFEHKLCHKFHLFQRFANQFRLNKTHVVIFLLVKYVDGT